MNIGLIGYGYWGKNILRNVIECGFWEKILLFDSNEDALTRAKKTYPNLVICCHSDELFENDSVHSVIICTPPQTHYAYCKKAIKHNKHILIEKPFTTSLSQAIEIKKLADKNNVKIMIDYTFIYTESVQKIKQLFDSKQLGNLLYIDSTRINLGIFQNDVNVLWDLACHDFSIFNFILNKKPKSISSTGVAHTLSGLENICYVSLNYDDHFIAHIHCSWTSPVKIRQMLICGNEKMIVYNDIEPADKIKIYDSSFRETTTEDKNKLLIDYRIGDVYSPKLDNKEALKSVINEFYSYSIGNKSCKTDLSFGIKVIQMLDAAEKSLKNKGKEVFL